MYYVLSTSRRVPRHAFEVNFGLKVHQRRSKNTSREWTRKSIEKVPQNNAKRPPKWVPGATKNAPDSRLETLKEPRGTPGGLRGTTKAKKCSNFDENWKKMHASDAIKMEEKSIPECYRKSAIVAPYTWTGTWEVRRGRLHKEKFRDCTVRSTALKLPKHKVYDKSLGKTYLFILALQRSLYKYY